MKRRRFLKASGTAVMGLAAAGCAPGLIGRGAPRRPLVNVFPVEVSWDRVIRTTVGLRPHRGSGFRLEAERLDHKTVIHNYGHGGSGMALSWGTGSLAADLALAHADRRAAVIGCGIVGLTAARQLQRRGFDVTIYAKALPPETTSNVCWGSFTPTSGLLSGGAPLPRWEEQFRKAVQIAYVEHQLLVGRGYGVSWIHDYSPTNNAQGGGGGGGGNALLPSTVRTGSALLQPGEHPFDTRYARRGVTLRLEPSIYLEALMQDVLAFGGRIVVREFGTPRDLMALPEVLIVNCTGLGARQLFGDEELTPIRGQLVVLVPQPEVDYSLGAMLPRSDGIVLGHTNQRGEWELEVDEEARIRVIENHIRTFAAIRPPREPVPPLRVTMTDSPPPVESFFGLES